MTLWPGHYLEGYLDANGIRIHYYRTGGNKPPVVLLHGFTDSGLCWLPVAKVLQERYDVIMPDTRGHNLSANIGEGFTTPALVADVLALIKGLELKQPFLIGHSMGAEIAALVSVQHPELVRAVVLEDPPWNYREVPTSIEEYEQFAQNWKAGQQTLKALTYEERLAKIHKEQPGWSDEEIQPWAAATEHFNMAIFDNGGGEALRSWQGLVPNLTRPALLVIGDPKRGAIVRPEMAREAISTWQDGHIVAIANAGHCIRRDQFQPFMQAVTAFLAEH